MDKNKVVNYIETALGADTCNVTVHLGRDASITISVYWIETKNIYSKRFGNGVLQYLDSDAMAEQFIDAALKNKLV